MALIPVAMIVQLLFGGAIVTVKNMGAVMATLSGLVFSRWAFGGVGQTVDMNERIAGDPGFSSSNPYSESFFDVPWAGTIAILAVFVAAQLVLTGVLLERRRE